MENKYPKCLETSRYADRFNFYLHDRLMTSMDFYYRLKEYTSVEVMCYSFHCRMVIPSIKLKRIIACKIYPFESVKLKLFKLANNIHTKIYICRRGKATHVFVGSWNFAPPTYLDILYRVDEADNQQLITYYEQVWKGLT